MRTAIYLHGSRESNMIRIENRTESGAERVDAYLDEGLQGFSWSGSGELVDWRQAIGCGTYRWERHRVSVKPSSERTASPGANRNLKAVAESVPTVQPPEPSYFWVCPFESQNSRRMWTVRLAKTCSVMMSIYLYCICHHLDSIDSNTSRMSLRMVLLKLL
jgi:hypothetical protein